ncbi:hypothetical protein CAPTEDRAFT_112484, partial [Capitella teleta]
VKCNYPGRPTNGDIDGTSPAIFGTVATFSCDDGFSLNGNSEIICQANGKWSGSKPSCVCKMLPPQ